MLLIVLAEPSGSLPTWGELVLIGLSFLLGIVGGVAGTVLRRAWHRRGHLKTIDTKIHHNQQKLESGKIGALNTSAWEDNEVEIAKLLRGEDYRTLEDYHYRLDKLKPASGAEDVQKVVKLGQQCRGIIRYYTTGWRKHIGVLPWE
jgi:hypothetical protein